MIKRLNWDSDFFQLEVGELNYNDNKKVEFQSHFDLIYLKSESFSELNLPNFKKSFSETKVLFSKQISNVNPTYKKIKSSKEVTFDLDDLYTLSFESGKFSRFNLDANFKTTDFKKLYKIWIDNSINFEFATEVLLYLEQDKITGFVTYKIKDDFATIGLISVLPENQGKGIGKKLILEVENRLFQKKIKNLSIPTQLENEVACSFYLSLGYKIIEKTHISHYWKI